MVAKEKERQRFYFSIIKGKEHLSASTLKPLSVKMKL
jgi:hypothetical protein